MEGGSSPCPPPVSSFAVYFLEESLTILGTSGGCWGALSLQLPAAWEEARLRRQKQGWEERSATLLAGDTLPAFPVCCHGYAEMGLPVPAVRGEVSLSASRCPVPLAMLLEKCREEMGWRGDMQQRNCSAGEIWSCGWWEWWGKPSWGTSCPSPTQSCPSQSGLVAPGMGLAGLPPSDGWTWSCTTSDVC